MLERGPMAQSNGYDWNVIPLLSNNDDAQTAHKTDNLNLKELSECPPPLGLKLTVTPEMLQLPEQKPNGVATTRTPCMPDVKKAEKLKAAHFPISMLMIGIFKIEAKYPADLVAKFYYAKRKLVWEILRDGLKDKIEIQWQNISAIRAAVGATSLGILEIELDSVPLFFREIEPKPGKHTMWTISHDFTNGQASRHRKHYLQFTPGVLDQHYAKLLQCDNRLLGLSQRPFPSLNYYYFDSNLDQGTEHISFGDDLHVDGSKITSTSEQQPILFSPHKIQHLRSLPLIANNSLTSSTSGICSPTDEVINYQMLEYPILTSWSQDLNNDTSISIESVTCASSVQRNRLELNYELFSHINNVLLQGYHIPEIEFYRRHMGDNVESVSSNVDQSIEASLIYNTHVNTQIDWLHTNKNS